MRMVRAPWAALLGALLAAAAGCAGKDYAQVEGTVTLGGVPLPDVEVMFVPEPSKGNTGNNASATTDAQGRYRLSTPKDNREGAAVGTYRVVVTDLRMAAVPTGGLPPAVGESAPAAPPGSKTRRFPASYGDLTETPLKGVEVKPGKQTIDLDVKAGGK